MSEALAKRTPARQAGADLLVLQKWEEFAGWLLQHTSRWPKSVRFTLCQRTQSHALEVADLLVVARYQPAERALALERANLLLERMRLFLRLALATGASSKRGFESAMRGIDETGRMIYGWREAIGARTSAKGARE